jgi:hypothetical protein
MSDDRVLMDKATDGSDPLGIDCKPSGLDIFLKMREIGRPRNGNDMRPLGETPGECKLRWGTACLLSDIDHRPQQRYIPHQCIPLESRILVTHVRVMKQFQTLCIPKAGREESTP